MSGTITIRINYYFFYSTHNTQCYTIQYSVTILRSKCHIYSYLIYFCGQVIVCNLNSTPSLLTIILSYAIQYLILLRVCSKIIARSSRFQPCLPFQGSTFLESQFKTYENVTRIIKYSEKRESFKCPSPNLLIEKTRGTISL